MANELRILDVLVDAREYWGNSYSYKLKCPICGSTDQHARTPERSGNTVPYGDKWGGKGDLLVIPVEGECSHVWEICLGFHKGETICFARTTGRVPSEPVTG